MTRDHLIEDIRNVLQMAHPPVNAKQAQQIRSAFVGLHRHVGTEPDVPERVQSCLAESIRVLEQAGSEVDDSTWDYARTCLESALDFALQPESERAQVLPPA